MKAVNQTSTTELITDMTPEQQDSVFHARNKFGGISIFGLPVYVDEKCEGGILVRGSASDIAMLHVKIDNGLWVAPVPLALTLNERVTLCEQRLEKLEGGAG